VEQSFRLMQEDPTGSGQLCSSAPAHEQRCVDAVFQLPDLSAERGLREVKSDCCSTEVAFLGDRDKIPEMTEFQFVVNAAPAPRLLCGHDLLPALGVVEIRYSGADSLAMYGVSGEDWTGLWYSEYGCGFKGRGYD